MSIDSSENEKLIKYADLKNTILNAKNLNFQNYNEKNEYLLEAIRKKLLTHIKFLMFQLLYCCQGN